MADKKFILPSPFDKDGKLLTPKLDGPSPALTPEKFVWPPPEGSCFHCDYCLPQDQGIEVLRRQKYWRKIFNLYGDGTDVKPHHVGNPMFFSVCKYKKIAVHVSAPGCEFYKGTKTIAKVYGGIGK